MKNRIQQYINIESLSGILLFGGMILALGISNSGLYEAYLSLINLPISITIGDFSLSKPLIKWTNDGLMATFFLVITLEAKFHFLEGEFTSKENLLLPITAALGGVVIPAIFYYSITYGDNLYSRGWAIPVATDTAFILGILSFFSTKISLSVRLLVVALSIIDDIIAVLILALFYTDSISYFPLLITAIILLLLVIMNLLNVSKLSVYLIVGIALWLSLVEAGIHGTIAGVLLGLFIPQRVKNEEDKVQSPLKRLEHSLHPVVALIILPLFAFLNCEIPFNELSLNDFYSPITLGILGGLFIGKQVGIISFSFIAIKLRLCKLSHGLNWRTYYAISILCGIGFTFSLFIGGLSFESEPLMNQMKLGVILGSLLSALLGAFLLRIVTRNSQ
jgi:NhaA family Na+:H+ antiporter